MRLSSRGCGTRLPLLHEAAQRPVSEQARHACKLHERTPGSPAHGIAFSSIIAGRHDDEVRAVLIDDGQEDVHEGCHVIGITHATHRPRYIDCKPLALPPANLMYTASAWVEVTPVNVNGSLRLGVS